MKQSVLALLLGSALAIRNNPILRYDTSLYEQQYSDANRGLTEARKEFEDNQESLSKKEYKKFTDIRGNNDYDHYATAYAATAAHDRLV